MQGVHIILLGFLLVVFAMVAAWLMVLRIVPPSFWLSFLTYGASVLGLFLGLIGAAFYVRRRRK